jgi:hypothetical protein
MPCWRFRQATSARQPRTRSRVGGYLKVCALKHANSDKQRTRDQATRLATQVVLEALGEGKASAAWRRLCLEPMGKPESFFRFRLAASPRSATANLK